MKKEQFYLPMKNHDGVQYETISSSILEIDWLWLLNLEEHI